MPWENSTNGVSFSPIGATGSTYTSPALTQDTWFRRTVTATLNGFTCSEQTLPVRVTVNNFDPGTISADQTICEGGTPAPFTSVAPSGDGILTYQWQSSIDGSAYSNITGATARNLFSRSPCTGYMVQAAGDLDPQQHHLY